jgi:hypothetical protein
MKGFASELATAGKTVDDDELKDYMMNGLDGSYNGFVASLKVVPPHPSMACALNCCLMRIVILCSPPQARLPCRLCRMLMLPLVF